MRITFVPLRHGAEPSKVLLSRATWSALGADAARLPAWSGRLSAGWRHLCARSYLACAGGGPGTAGASWPPLSARRGTAWSTRTLRRAAVRLRGLRLRPLSCELISSRALSQLRRHFCGNEDGHCQGHWPV